ncbi:hypothetical protein ScPMuIL_000970 [Solemya velum]
MGKNKVLVKRKDYKEKPCTKSLIRKLGATATAIDGVLGENGKEPSHEEESQIKLKTPHFMEDFRLGVSFTTVPYDASRTHGESQGVINRHFVTQTTGEHESEIRCGDELLMVNETRVFGMSHDATKLCFPAMKPNVLLKLKLILRRWIKREGTEEYDILYIEMEFDIEFEDGHFRARSYSSFRLEVLSPAGTLIKQTQEVYLIRCERFYIKATGSYGLATKPLKDKDKSYYEFIVTTYELLESSGGLLFVATFQSSHYPDYFLQSDIKNKSSKVRLTNQSSEVDPSHPDERFFIKYRTRTGSRYVFESLLHRGYVLQMRQRKGDMVMVKEEEDTQNAYCHFEMFPRQQLIDEEPDTEVKQKQCSKWLCCLLVASR